MHTQQVLKRFAGPAVLGGWLALCAWGGCNTPSIPLPPPDLQALSFVAPSPGHLVLHGTPNPSNANARFFIIDDTTGDGTIKDTKDGGFDTDPFEGQAGDRVTLWYVKSGSSSQLTVCTVKVGSPLDSTVCH